ncbi:MAG: acetolactate decarboxylase [Mycobacterium sp.]
MTASGAHQIYQTGTINSLVNAVYDGDKTISAIRKHGDFGLGALPMMDGELIVCDGVFYRADADANLSVAGEGTVLPFAVVSRFTPNQTFDLINTDMTGASEFVSRYFGSQNLIYAIRIDGLFAAIRVRSELCQPKTYRPMAETMPDLQRIRDVENIEGTLVGIWYPDYLSQINVPGFHFHFVDDNRTLGGHVFTFALTRGRVSIQTMTSLQVDLINNNEFAEANLNSVAPGAVDQLEKHD